MKIKTHQFGEIEVKEEEIINFPKGIPGFLEEKQFYLFSNSDHAPFMWLQSLSTPYLAFVLLDPWLVFPDYEIVLPEEFKGSLKIDNTKQVLVLGIVTVPQPPQKTTINLRAPLVINVVERLGEQFILPDDQYEVRYPILAE